MVKRSKSYIQYILHFYIYVLEEYLPVVDGIVRILFVLLESYIDRPKGLRRTIQSLPTSLKIDFAETQPPTP